MTRPAKDWADPLFDSAANLFAFVAALWAALAFAAWRLGWLA